MLQRFKNKLKDQRGLTLIELLAVIVILGIIAAIAIPSILGIIDNTKKDAHVANAQQMVSSAKLAVAQNSTLQNNSQAQYLTLGYLYSQKYLETMKDPDNLGYQYDNTVTTVQTTVPTGSYVTVVSGNVTGVKLVNSNRGIQLQNNGAVPFDPLNPLTRDTVFPK